MNNHIPEWKRIKSEYQERVRLRTQLNAPKEDIEPYKFRIECIDSLIESQENKEKELAHFR